MTETQLTTYYVQAGYPIHYSDGKGTFLENGHYVLSHMSDLSSVRERNLIRDKFNLDHLIYFVDKYAYSDDIYIFASHPDNHRFINNLINNLKFIKHYLHYYKHQSRKMLFNAPRIRYPQEYFVKQVDLDIQVDIKQAVEKMALKKIYLPVDGEEVVITIQEYKCLKYIIQNYTLKEIAKFLELSPRTVETYLNNLKNKLGCDNKSQLIELTNRVNLL